MLHASTPPVVVMAVADAERWDDRYRAGSTPTAAAPDALLAAGLVDAIPTTGRALDVACGSGAQALWLAGRGLTVTALDVSAEGIALAAKAATDAGLDDRVGFARHDLDGGLPATPSDVDVLLCQRFRDPRLYPEFVTRLAIGGIGIVTVLSRTGARSPGPFHAPSGELSAAFGRDDCDVLSHSETDGEESIVFRRVRSDDG